MTHVFFNQTPPFFNVNRKHLCGSKNADHQSTEFSNQFQYFNHKINPEAETQVWEWDKTKTLTESKILQPPTLVTSLYCVVLPNEYNQGL